MVQISSGLFILLVVSSSSSWLKRVASNPIPGICEPNCHCIPSADSDSSSGSDSSSEGDELPVCPDVGDRLPAVAYFQAGLDQYFSDLVQDPNYDFPSLEPAGCQPYPLVLDFLGGGELCDLPNGGSSSGSSSEDSDEQVCAFVYSDDCDGTYHLETFEDAEEAENTVGAVITHFDACGVCSTADDLAVYMNPAVSIQSVTCGLAVAIPLMFNMMYGASLPAPPAVLFAQVVGCFIGLGFSQDCALLWASNSVNSALAGCTCDCIDWLADCIPPLPGLLNPCIIPPTPFSGNPSTCAQTISQPTDPDCSLNACLSCDDDASGLLFEVLAGRTRRKSGILTTFTDPVTGLVLGLKRDCDSIANLRQEVC